MERGQGWGKWDEMKVKNRKEVKFMRLYDLTFARLNYGVCFLVYFVLARCLDTERGAV